jgi:hypothetical protein
MGDKFITYFLRAFMICPVAAQKWQRELRVPLAGVTGNAYFRSNHKP